MSEWWTAGSAPVLLIQGLEDAIAPPENARLLQQEIGDRVKVVELADAGHALLPERPAAIADAILDFLRAR